MRPRRPDSDHQEAVARRLELLSAELAAARASADGGHDADPVHDPVPETHTRVRPAPSAGDSAAAWAVGPVPEWEGGPAPAGTVGEPDRWTDPSHEPTMTASVQSSGTWAPATDEPPALPMPGRHASRPPAKHLITMVPETLRGRITLTPHHLTLIALAVALGLGVTAWWVVRGDAVGQPVSAPVAA
ncbi:hypothetical protein, partial [Nocardioides sp.]|uniref:hypothetical protein n=1 Tax=Nocardioides sp. TaxID=35761 RepID=UPI002734D59B